LDTPKESFADFSHLLKAAKRAARSHKKKPYVQRFNFYLERELVGLQRELNTQTYQPRPLKPFVLMEPKRREIHSSHFRDRVVHHAICAHLEPKFEARFIGQSYACRKGRGQIQGVLDFYRQIRRIPSELRQNFTIVKADVKSYFASINHRTLFALISPHVEGPVMGQTILKIITAHNGSHQTGLPIGNLTSQLYANLYLNELDHYIKQKNLPYYFRYMDDFIVICDRRYHQQAQVLADIVDFLHTRLQLKLNPKKLFCKDLQRGMEFLGYHASPRGILIKPKNLARLKRKLSKRHAALCEGLIPIDRYILSLVSWRGILTHSHASAQKINLVLWAVKKFGAGSAYLIWYYFLWTLKNPPLAIRRLRSVLKDDHTAYRLWLESHGLNASETVTFPASSPIVLDGQGDLRCPPPRPLPSP